MAILLPCHRGWLGVRLLRLLVLRLLLPRYGISGLLRLLELLLLRLLELLRLLRSGGLLPGLCVDSRAAPGTELCIVI